MYLLISAICLFALFITIKLLFTLIRIIHDKRETFVFFEITPPKHTEIASVSTSQLFTLICDLLKQNGWIDKIFVRQHSSSFEVVSTKNGGIKYILRVPKSISDSVEKSLRSYANGIKLKRIEDYIQKDSIKNKSYKVLEFKLGEHFTLPINEQVDLTKHDPLAYITGNMTKLKQDEITAMQVIIRPVNKIDRLFTRKEIYSIKRQINLNSYFHKTKLQKFADWFLHVIEFIVRTIMIPLYFISEFLTGIQNPELKSAVGLDKPTSYDKENAKFIKGKLDRPIYETTVRVLLVSDKASIYPRIKGLCATFSSFTHQSGQAIILKPVLPLSIVNKWNLYKFANRLGGQPVFLSSAEIASLCHFPHSKNSQAEDLLRVKSKDLPAPLALKNNQNLDTVFGKSTYANDAVNIGLTNDDRSRHVYLLGQTGSGKSTVMYHMASDDIKKGRGLAVIDPHGDLAEGLLDNVPDSRINDLVYFNPFDIKYPMGINLLELNPELEGDELELEKELVCESTVSIFRRVFFKDESTDAHRIEYILRNAIHTAFTVPEHTIFTVYDLLNNKNFRRSAIKNLEDENLINFWKNEFGKAGDYQHVKMVGGVTAKIGRFLFSPVAKRILEQPKSTINFEDILNNSKILICNLAEGKLGDDTSQLLGATIIAKIHQAATRRARMKTESRTPFYLFVDEFQNFATSSFNKLLSGGRKFGLHITIAQQSTAQQDDKNLVNVILANTGTVICFRTASPIDEGLMLSQFAPAVEKGDIGNLPRFHYYMRLAATEPQDAFSGITLPILTIRRPQKIKKLIDASRRNYANEYRKKKKENQIIKSESKIIKAKKTSAKSLDSIA